MSTPKCELLVIPFTLDNGSSYSVVAVLSEENLTRIRNHDPACIDLAHVEMMTEIPSHTRLNEVHITYGTQEEIAEAMRLIKEDRGIDAVRLVTRGYRFRPKTN